MILMNSERFNLNMSEIEQTDIIENEIIHQLYPASLGYNQIIEKLKVIKKVIDILIFFSSIKREYLFFSEAEVKL